MIIDSWAQHPTLRHQQGPLFDSLRRWTQGAQAAAITTRLRPAVLAS